MKGISFYCDKRIPFSIISNYRAAIMGGAILTVLYSHFIVLGDFVNPYTNALSLLFQTLNYTPAFFLVSGFGLYYSFSSDSNLLSFYKKRLLKVYVPYILILTPFLIVYLTIDAISLEEGVSLITTFFYWVEGNKWGLWYIPVCLMSYLLFPLIHGFTSRCSLFSMSLSILLSLLLVFMIGNSTDPSHCPEAICHFPYFVAGIWFGHFANNGKQIRLVTFAIVVVIVVLFYILSVKYFLLFKGIALVFVHIAGIFFFALSLRSLDNANGRPFIVILKWTGKYTLEIYLLQSLFYNLFRFLSINSRSSILIACILSILTCACFNKYTTTVVNKID